MMTIGKRVFYDKRNGEVLVIVGERSGHVRPTTVEEDIDSFPKLQERNPDTLAYIDLEYGEFAQDFREGKLVAVELETKELLFVYHDDEERQPRTSLSEEVKELKEITTITMTAVAESYEELIKLKEMNKDKF